MDFSRLQTFLDFLPEGKGIPGVDCSVYKDGAEVFRHSAGYNDIERKTPVRRDALYNMYSCSKVATCTAALTLYERGKFLLGDPVYEYLPEFRDVTVRISGTEAVPSEKPITVRQLFNMTAGLDYDLVAPELRKVKAETGGRCPTRETIKALAARPLWFIPGTKWQYSLCHDVLGAMIEAISGQSFGSYMKENIFDPAGMKDTCFFLPESKKDRFAVQYTYNLNTKLPEKILPGNVYRLGTEYESGGAGLISSVDDYIRFLYALANSGVTETGERLISPATINLMRTDTLSEENRASFDWEQMVGYGYGLGVRTMIDRMCGGSNGPVGEFGWGGAAGQYILIDPENHLAMFYAQHMLNNPEPWVHPRLRNILYSCL